MSESFIGGLPVELWHLIADQHYKTYYVLTLTCKRFLRHVECMKDFFAKEYPVDKPLTNIMCYLVRYVKPLETDGINYSMGGGVIYALPNGDIHRGDDLPAEIYDNGMRVWRNNGLLHRDDNLPAITTPSGYLRWFVDGDEYCDNGPHSIDFDGLMIYGEEYHNNELPHITHPTFKLWTNDYGRHREDDLPAMILRNGTKIYYYNNVRHRENDRPAVIRRDGVKKYYRWGKLHRENGPAIEAPGYAEYFINGRHKRLDGGAVIEDRINNHVRWTQSSSEDYTSLDSDDPEKYQEWSDSDNSDRLEPSDDSGLNFSEGEPDDSDYYQHTGTTDDEENISGE